MLAHRLAGSVTEFITSAARAAMPPTTTWWCGRSAMTAASWPALVGQKLVDGVLLMEVQLDDARVAALRELDIPFALIGRTRDVTGLHYVDIDFDATMRTAMDHLAELGPPSDCAGQRQRGRRELRQLWAVRPLEIAYAGFAHSARSSLLSCAAGSRCARGVTLGWSWWPPRRRPPP